MKSMRSFLLCCLAGTAVSVVAGLDNVRQQLHAGDGPAMADSNASQYAVVWPALLPEPGTSKDNLGTYYNSMPLGNGHVAVSFGPLAGFIQLTA